MKIPELYFLKEWSANRDRIRWRFFVKSEIYFGSDRDTDVQIEGQGLRARLNFRDKEFEDFETRSARSLKETELLVLGSKVFSWRRFSLKKSVLVWGAFAILLIFLGRLALSASGCDPRDLNEEERRSAAFIRELIDSKSFIQARARLNSIFSRFEDELCLPLELRELELELAEGIVIQRLEEKKYLEAASYLAGTEDRLEAQNIQALTEQILLGAQHLFWRSWSLERKDPGESYRLQREAQQICQRLRLESSCFLKQENQ